MISSGKAILLILDTSRVFEVNIIPTTPQIWQCFVLCYQLTKMYMPIYLVRLDQRTNNVVILASEEIKISIDQNGEWIKGEEI